MVNEKLDTQLELAMDVSKQVRERTLDLNTGYDPQTDTWELIVRYNGDIESIVAALDGRVTVLFSSYAIVTLKEEKIEEFAAFNEVEFIEKPRRIYFDINNAKAASCVMPLYNEPYELSGRGTLVGIIDSGVDFRNDDFRNFDGTTRIEYFYDLSGDGGVYTAQDINEILQGDLNYGQADGAAVRQVFSGDTSGHGTSVAGIACGNGRASSGRYRGVAYEAGIIVVKLGREAGSRFPGTTGIMRGVDFCIRRAIELNMPIAINISYGNNYGSHSGNSLLETYLDEAAGLWKTSIVVAAGNEGATGHHAQGRLAARERRSIEFVISEYTGSINLQLWKNFNDTFTAELVSPSGERFAAEMQAAGTVRYRLSNTDIYFFYGEPQPYNIFEELYFEFVPVREYIDSGIWQIVLTGTEVVFGEYFLWLPAGELSGQGVRFLQASEETTLTIPSTAARVITVGAYDYSSDAPAYFSGRGYTALEQVKPDIAAPGVNIMAPSVNNTYTRRTGTSFAAPIVAGSAALLLEWGVVNGNDPYLFGEKLKAYLQRGAQPVQGERTYPNPHVGWGRLCLRDSLMG